MSTTPSRSILLPAKSDQFRSGTPGRNRSAACDTPGPTLSECSSSTPKVQEDDPDGVEEPNRKEYNTVYQDLNSRVFVDFEVFLQSVLHVPRDWKTLWGPAIEAVKAGQEFSTRHGEYCRRCEDYGASRQSFSDPLTKTANKIVDVVSSSKFDGISGIPLRWANNLHILEAKPYDKAICNGNHMPRLIVDGKVYSVLLMALSTGC